MLPKDSFRSFDGVEKVTKEASNESFEWRTAKDFHIDRNTWEHLGSESDDEDWLPANPKSQVDSSTVDEALEKIGFGYFQVKVVIICGLFLGVDAMEIMLLSFVGPCLHCEWRISIEEEAFLTFSVFTGSLFGGYFWGAVADAYGRQPVIRFITLFAFLLGLFSAFASSYPVIAATRGIIGFCMGGVNVVVTYCIEMLPTSYRGRYAIIIEMFWTVGTLFQVFLAWYIFVNANSLGSWRYLVAWSSAPCLLSFLCFTMMPESPRYLVASGRVHDAFKVLYRMSLENGRELLYLLDFPRQAETSYVSIRTTGCFALISHLCNVLKAMFGKQFRLTTLLLWIAWFSCAFCYYGIVILATAFAEKSNDQADITTDVCHNLTGIPFDTSADFVDLSIDTASEFPGVLIAMVLIMQIGRRKLLVIFFLLGAVSLSLLVFLEITEFLSVFSLFFGRMFVMAAFVTIYVYTPEVYPTRFRSTAFGLAVSISRIGGMVAPFVVKEMVEAGYVKHSVAVFVVAMLIASVTCSALPHETMGKALVDA